MRSIPSRHLLRRSRSSAFLIGAALSIAWACSDVGLPSAPVARDIYTGSCALTYTSTTTLEDEELADYGVAAQTETVSVCETWTGGDYTGYMVRTASSEPESEYSDDIKSVTYTDGQVSSNDATGAQIAAPEAVGPDAFDVVQANDAERQASYDDPYYGVYSGGGCADPTQIYCDPQPNMSRNVPLPGTSASATDTTKHPRKFSRHGLNRRGIRALVDDKEEVARGPDGHRRFRSVRGDEENVIELDPATELMVVEETTSPRGHTKASLHWAKKKDNYVRDLMDVESDEIVNGKSRHSHATIRLSNLAVGVQP